MSGNQINVSVIPPGPVGGSTGAIGFLVNGNTSTITSNNDTFIVSTSEGNAGNNAYGIAANILGTTASGNTITLTGDTMQVTSATLTNAAYGVFDTDNTTNNWNPGSGGLASDNATDIINANAITVRAALRAKSGLVSSASTHKQWNIHLKHRKIGEGEPHGFY